MKNIEIRRFFEWDSVDKAIHHDELQRMANHPKMKNAKRDTISFSTEGLEALHGQKLHGAVDVETMKR